MDRNYDIFEIVDTAPIWRGAITGHDAAIARLRKLAEHSQNEFRLMHLPTNSLIALIPAKRPANSANPRESPQPNPAGENPENENPVGPT